MANTPYDSVSPVPDSSDGAILAEIEACVSHRQLYFKAYSYLSVSVFLLVTGVIKMQEMTRRHAVMTELVGRQVNVIHKLTKIPQVHYENHPDFRGVVVRAAEGEHPASEESTLL